eukprot:c19619_g1_i2 orf=163-1107(-)
MFLSKIQNRTQSDMRDSTTSLVLGMDLSLHVPSNLNELSSRRFSPPMPLELLPLHPGTRPASQNVSTTPVSCFTSQLPMAQEPPSAAHTSPPRDFDMNRMPSAECDDGMASSPDSVISPFHMEPDQRREISSPLKREREVNHDLDLEGSKYQDVSSRNSDDEDVGSTRKKLRLTKQQSALLEESFKEHSTLNPKQKTALSKQLCLRPRQVEVWFQNRRARTKLKQTEVDCELLKRCCESLTEENRRLQKELQELRAIKVAPPCVITHDFYMPLPAATLTMCPSCEKMAAIDSSRNLTFSKSQYCSQIRQPSAAC